MYDAQICFYGSVRIVNIFFSELLLLRWVEIALANGQCQPQSI